MGSLMADLETNLESLNKWKAKHGQQPLTQDELLIKLFDEVAYIWPKVGYPCLVTPFSQYVKNLALMNVIQMEKGKERWSMIADDIWDMLLGKAGRLPGEVAAGTERTGPSTGTTVLRLRPASQLSGRTGQVQATDGRKRMGHGQGRRGTLRICHASVAI